MAIDEVSGGIIYKAPSLHPAFYPKNHGADNAEVSGSTPRRIAGKPNVQPPQTGLIEQHLQLKTSCNSLSGLDLSLPPVKYLHVSLYPFFASLVA